MKRLRWQTIKVRWRVRTFIGRFMILAFNLSRLAGFFLCRIGGIDIDEITKRQNRLADEIHEIVILVECEKDDVTSKLNSLLSKYPHSNSSFFDYNMMDKEDRDCYLMLSGKRSMLSMIQGKTVFMRLDL